MIMEKAKEIKIVPGINGDLSITKNSFNYTAFNKKNKAIKVISSLDGIEQKKLFPIQLENILVVVGNNHILFQETIGGLFSFNEEKELVRERHLDENELLFKPPSFNWAASVDGGKFEELIKDLLEREPGVKWVRKVSHTNEQDGGRDLIAEWRTMAMPHEINDKNAIPFKTRKIIIQCKASNDGIGKSNVTDIRDTVEHSEYDGYFLAVSSYTKRSLTDALDKIKTDGKIWVDWWTRDEIEKRLIWHVDLLQKYPMIISAN